MTTQNSFMNPPEEFNSQDAYELALRTLRKYIFAGKQSDTIDGVCATIWSVCVNQITIYLILSMR